MYKLLIKNGTIIDGISKNAFKSDLAIDRGRIIEISPDIPLNSASKFIDARGMFIAPGFIDLQNHSDSYWTLFEQPELTSLLSQGITTIILGNCGSSLAPLVTPESIKTIQKWHPLSGVNFNWSSFDEFLSVLAQIKFGVNIGSLVGHSTIRRGILGDQVRKVTGDETRVMTDMLKKALEEGAFGLSMGLVYAHEVDSGLEELEVLAATLKSSGKYLSLHLRSEEDSIIDSIDEGLYLGKKLEIPVKFSHLKIRGKDNWHLFDRMIVKLDNAYHQGTKVSYDVYPYYTSWSVLYTYLPKWAYEGGRYEVLRRIANEDDRRKILDYLRQKQYDFSNIKIATAANNPSLIGRSITHIAINQGVTNEEALLNVLSACDTQAIVFDKNLSEEQVELLATAPLSIISTDGAGYSKELDELVHPRCYGTMPRFLSWVREKKIMTWEQAIKKITSEPANLLGLSERGRIKPNAIADLVIFDPNKINDIATFEHPYQLSDGIAEVIVNGEQAYNNKGIRGTFGKILRR